VIRPTHGGNLDWAATIANCQIGSLLDFSASINPLGPPLSAIKAIKEGIKQLHYYPSPDYQSLRQALADDHHLTLDYILPGNGAAELLTWAAWASVNLESVYLPSPGFADYQRAFTTFQVKTLFYSLSQLTKGINVYPNCGLLINNPHNPTGQLWTKSLLESYLEQFTLVIVDEAFMDFLLPYEQESLISLVKKYDNLIILRSLTKFYSLPGLRLGYIVSHPERINQWQKWRDPWSVNILAALAGEEVIRDRSFQQQTWDWLAPTKTHLFEQLQNFAQFKPLNSWANFLLVETEIPSSQLQLNLLKNHQILIRDCLSFPELGDRYFRVAVRTTKENERLINALTQTLS
jgi:L-threonine-O-3-phosphate decarboxylase